MTTATSTALGVFPFGTSGYRNNTEAGFSPEVVRHITQSIATVLIEDMHASGQALPVLVGGDTRDKTKMALPIVVETLLAHGLDVYEVDGEVPTPVLAFAAAHFSRLCGTATGCAGAILLTASHNPWLYGGYNMLTPQGAVVPASLSSRFEAAQAAPKTITLNREGLGLQEPPKLRRIQPYNAYFRHLQQLGFSAERLAKHPVTVLYDAMFATGRYYFTKLLDDLKVPHTALHLEPQSPADLEGHEPEPSPKYLGAMSQQLQALAAHSATPPLALGLANDGDADRFGIMDEQGRFVPPNDVLALVLYWALKHRPWPQGQAPAGGVLIRSQATTHALDAMAASAGLSVQATPVGFKYVAEAFEHAEHEGTYVCLGGEGSGGLSIGGHLPEKDGLLANLIVLDLVAQEGKPLSTLLAEIKAAWPCTFVSEEWRIETDAKDELMAVGQALYAQGGCLRGLEVDVKATHAAAEALKAQFGTADGVKLVLEEGSWVLLRPSGTEPFIRLYVEVQAPTPQEAAAKATQLRAYWQAVLHSHGIGADKIMVKG
jgi:phosphomannomutase